MASENTIIIDVEVNAGDVAQKLAAVKNEIADLKDQQKQLNRQMREGEPLTAEQARLYAENEKAIKDLTAQEKMYTAQLNITTNGNRELGDSYIEMSRTLASLKQEYRGMTKEQRESAGGQELLKSIQQLDKNMKDADASMGDYQRNVGHYENALNGLGGRAIQVGNLFRGGFRNGLSAAGNAVKSFGKTLLTTPVGWIAAAVAALIGVFKQLQAAFKRNDDAGTALSVALSKLQPIATAVMKVFDAMATVVAKVVGGFASAATAVLRLIPSFREAQDAAGELVVAQDKLEDKQREFSTEQAKRNEEIARLNKEARGNEKLTAKEREDIYRQMDELSRQNMEDAVTLAKEEYDNLVKSNSQKRKLSDEDKNRETEYYNRLIEARTAYYNETTRIASREASARKEQAAAEEAARRERESRWREAQQKRIEAKRTETEELRKLEDLQLKTVKDAAQRAEAEIQLQYNRQIEDLQKRLDEEKNLTKAARAAINGQIVALNAERDAKLKEMRDMATDEAIARENEAQRMILEAQIAGMKDATDRQMAELNLRYDTEIEQLRETLATKADLTETETEALNAKITQLETEQAAKVAEIRASANNESIKKLYEDTAQQYANDLQRQLLRIGDDALAASEATLAAAESEHARLLAMDQATKDALGINQTQYETMVIESEQKVAEARKATQESFKQQVGEIGDTMHAVTGALSDLFEAASEDSEKYEKFKKAMAIVDAMISMATTIAQAVSVSTAGDPYTMAVRIAANVAAVTAQFASVISAIKAATVPSAGSYAEGGVVPGTSYTGDRMTAHVNSGEMILTRQMQLEMLKLLSNGVPVERIDYNRMREAFAAAVRETPAPTLVYREFKAFERDVAMSEAKMRQ